MKLIREINGIQIKVGDEVTTFRGEKGILTGYFPPRHTGSTGRVYVKFGEREDSFFPSVIGAKIVE